MTVGEMMCKRKLEFYLLLIKLIRSGPLNKFVLNLNILRVVFSSTTTQPHSDFLLFKKRAEHTAERGKSILAHTLILS